jgi:hypothetical protein
MMASFILPSDAVRVADEEASDLVLDAKINHLAGGLMPQVAHAPLSPPAHFVLGPLQLLKASGVLLAAGLLFGDLPELPTSLPLQRADAAPGHDQRLAGVRSAWETSMQTCSSKPRFQTNVQAPEFSGKSSGKTRDGRPLPIGKRRCPFSLLTAWAGQWTG